MEITVRPLAKTEYPLLEDLLYEAIFVPEGTPAPPRDIINTPELLVYLTGFGTRRGDIALAAECDGRVVGAVWSRIMNDYGHIDDNTPSLAIALYPAYRSRGAGTALMRAILARLKAEGFARVSLAVWKQNFAVKLYKKVGFSVKDETDSEYIMVCTL